MAENLEQELSKLEQEYIEKRSEVEKRREVGEIEKLPSEKETLKEVVEEQVVQPSTAPTPQTTPGADLPSYQRPELQQQVQELIDLTFDKSIKDALIKVKATHNPALIDAFHDALVDNLYDQLVERGKIKELKLSS